MKLVIKVVNILVLIIALSGCSSIPIKTTPIIEQESLLQRCPEETPIPMGTDGKALIEALIAFQQQYTECATRHDDLIETLRKLQDAKKINK